MIKVKSGVGTSVLDLQMGNNFLLSLTCFITTAASPTQENFQRLDCPVLLETGPHSPKGANFLLRCYRMSTRMKLEEATPAGGGQCPLPDPGEGTAGISTQHEAWLQASAHSSVGLDPLALDRRVCRAAAGVVRRLLHATNTPFTQYMENLAVNRM